MIFTPYTRGMAFDTLTVFSGLAGVLAVLLGSALKWGALDNRRERLLDPDRLTQEMFCDPNLTDEERRYLHELAVLELPRRHICC